jgi:hypothetical protein
VTGGKGIGAGRGRAFGKCIGGVHCEIKMEMGWAIGFEGLWVRISGDCGLSEIWRDAQSIHVQYMMLCTAMLVYCCSDEGA